MDSFPADTLVPEPERRKAPSPTALRYRYGFCAIARGAIRPDQAGELERLSWAHRRIGPLDLWTHPETHLTIVEAGKRTYVFLGDVFVEDPAAAADPKPALADRLGALASGDDAALFALLDTLAGRFALLEIGGDRVRVFHDAMGARSLFYHDSRPFAVGSHAALLAEAVGADACPDVAAHCAHPGFRARKTNSLPGDRTIFRGVHALVPNNLFDSGTMRTARYWPRGPRRDASAGEFHDRLDAAMAALGAFTRGRYEPVLGLTGGIDTRVVIAAFLQQGVPFETVTWRLERLPEREQEIIRRLVALLDAPHQYAVGSPNIVQISRIGNRNAHPHREKSMVAAAAWGVFADRPHTLFLRGFGGEIIRGFYNLLPTQMTALTPSEMARMYFAPKGDAFPPDTVGFFEDYFRRGNYEGLDALGYDPNDIFYWEHRMGMWGTLVHNELDAAIRSIPTFNSRQLYAAALGLPPAERLTKRILIEATARYDRALGKVPVAKMMQAAVARANAPALVDRVKRSLF